MRSSPSSARCDRARSGAHTLLGFAAVLGCSDGGARSLSVTPAQPMRAPDAATVRDDDAGSHAIDVDGCPWDGVRGSGRHRVFVQGAQAEPDARGIYPLLHEWREDGRDALLCDDREFVNDTSGDGRWEPPEEPRPLGPSALVHGEHFIVGAGSYVEFAITLCADITGEVSFYIPNYDEPGSRVLHQLLVVHEGEEQLIAEVIDEEAGQSGYNPFVRVVHGVDPSAALGDELLLRSTNLSGVPFSVMVFSPPSEYESWLLVEVP